MSEYKTTIGQGGRVVIPVEFRRALRLEPGDEIILRLEEDGLRLYTAAQAVARAQALVRRYIRDGAGSNLSEELISDRRAEAARE